MTTQEIRQLAEKLRLAAKSIAECARASGDWNAATEADIEAYKWEKLLEERKEQEKKMTDLNKRVSRRRRKLTKETT